MYIPSWTFSYKFVRTGKTRQKCCGYVRGFKAIFQYPEFLFFSLFSQFVFLSKTPFDLREIRSKINGMNNFSNCRQNLRFWWENCGLFGLLELFWVVNKLMSLTKCLVLASICLLLVSILTSKGCS